MKIFTNRNKFNIFLIFILLASSASFVVKLTSTYEKDIVFKLVITDQISEKKIYDKSHDSVLAKVRGYGFNLAKFYLRTPELKISTKKLKESKNTYLWTQRDNFNETKLNFDSSIELLSISEDSILLYFDKFSSRKIKIKPNVIINYEPGFESFKTPLLSLDSVRVLGPLEILNKIEFIETEKIFLENINSDISLQIKLLRPEIDNLSLDNDLIKFDLDVDPYTEESIKVPVNIIGDFETNFNYYPKELLVKYFISVEEYIKTNPMDFKIDCFFDKNKSYLIPKITKQPIYVKNPRLSSSQIQLIILE
tara:strand:+ start:2339 stop:3262 length:924 start_codon:yes stop_codon:yes gene_type:complete